MERQLLLAQQEQEDGSGGGAAAAADSNGGDAGSGDDSSSTAATAAAAAAADGQLAVAAEAALAAAEEAARDSQHQIALLSSKLAAADARVERLTAELSRRPAATAVAAMAEQLAALSALTQQQLESEGWGSEAAAAAVTALAADPMEQIQPLLQVCLCVCWFHCLFVVLMVPSNTAGPASIPEACLTCCTSGKPQSCCALTLFLPLFIYPFNQQTNKPNQERCTKLERALQAAKSQAAAATEAASTAAVETQTLQASLKSSQQLVQQLESDLLAVSCSNSNSHSGSSHNSKAVADVAGLEALVGGAGPGAPTTINDGAGSAGVGSSDGTTSAAAAAAGVGGGDAAVLAAVTAQRDRFRGRIGELESQQAGLTAQLQAATAQVDGLTRDNVALVEKIRWVHVCVCVRTVGVESETRSLCLSA